MSESSDAPQYEPLAAADLLPLLASTPGGLILFDIDNTVANGMHADMAEFEVRPGAAQTVRDLVDAGYRVSFWSAATGRHARLVADRLDVTHLLTGTHDKPEWPMTTASAADRVGEVPVLTVDDDWSEALPGVPFHRVQAFWGTLVTATELAEYEAMQATRNPDTIA